MQPSLQQPGELGVPVEATAAEIVLMAGPAPGDPSTPPGQWRRLAS
jgi:hypothetical protein